MQTCRLTNWLGWLVRTVQGANISLTVGNDHTMLIPFPSPTQSGTILLTNPNVSTHDPNELTGYSHGVQGAVGCKYPEEKTKTVDTRN